MASGGSGWAGGGSTPIIRGDTREAPRCGKVFGFDESPKWYTACKDYYNYIEGRNQSRVLRRELRHVLARRHADGIALDNNQPLRAVRGYAGYVVGDDKPSRGLAEEVRKAATVRPGGGQLRRESMQWCRPWRFTSSCIVEPRLYTAQSMEKILLA